MRRLSSAGLGGVLLLSVMGCPREDENALVVFGPDSVVVLAPLVTPAFLLPPDGQTTFNILQPLGVDTTEQDVFGRATLGPYDLGLFADDPDFDFPGWNMWSTLRNSSQDPRLPALTGSTGEEEKGGQCAHWGPGFGGGEGVYDTWCQILNTQPNTTYTLIFVRYATRINGALDAVEMILTGQVTQPDELVPLGGAPAGFPTTLCNFSILEPHPGPNANPLVMGYATSGGDGSLTFDCLIDGNGVWWESEAGPPPPGAADSATFAPNVQQGFDLPFYNYAVAIVGQGDAANPVPTGPHAFRWQIGPDILEDGTPINNGLAPFPIRGDPSTVEPFAAQPDSVFAVLNNLAALGGGSVYQAWFFGGESAPAEAIGEYTRTDPATGDVLEGPTNTSTFVGGPGEITHNIDFPPPAEGRTHIVYTVESSAGASSPSQVQPLWALQFQVQGPKVATQDLSFGTFAGNTADQRQWAISGVGRGGLFGEQFRVEYGRLPRPPVGYKYVGWLIGDDAPETGPCAGMNPCRLPDETFTSPPPEYAVLEAADTDLEISDVVQPTTILEAFQSICHQVLVVVGEDSETGDDIVESRGPDTCYDFRDFNTFRLTLEPRAADPSAPGPTVVLEGLLPSPKAIKR